MTIDPFQEEDEDGIQILNTQYTGERARPAPPPGPPQHERAFPLPIRVRNGSIEAEGLMLEGTLLPWSEIQYLALGMVHHSLGSMDPPKTVVRQVFSKIANKGEPGSSSKTAQYAESILLDIYSRPSDPPYRLDSVNLNYRSFLGSDVLMISLHNFYRLAIRIARGATVARVNASFAALVKRRRDQIRPFGAVYDFELDSQNAVNTIEAQPAVTNLDLTRDNYAEEFEA